MAGMQGSGDVAFHSEVSGLPLFNYFLESDIDLMCRVRDGDTGSYAVLWERYRQPLVRFLRRMVGHDFVAEELAQEVFLRVYRARASYEPSAKFTTWLFRIAGHVAINWLRDFRHEKISSSIENETYESAPLQIADYRPTVEQELLRGSDREEIWQAIKRLPENQRTAVVMHKYREFSYARIARSLNCSESAVKSLLFRAYEHLRESLAHFEGRRISA